MNKKITVCLIPSDNYKKSVLKIKKGDDFVKYEDVKKYLTPEQINFIKNYNEVKKYTFEQQITLLLKNDDKKRILEAINKSLKITV